MNPSTPVLNRHGALADELRQRLEAEIVAGELPAGTRLDIKSVAERFGVSRTPAREALLQLATAGLIAYSPRRGGEVVSLTPAQVMALLEVALLLEEAAARLAARRMSVEDRATLRKLQDACAAAAEANDRQTYIAHNAALHQAIYRGCGNPFLCEQLVATRQRVAASYPNTFEQPGRMRASCDEHQALVAAICAGDEDSAGAAARRHVTVGGMVLTEFALRMVRPDRSV